MEKCYRRALFVPAAAAMFAAPGLAVEINLLPGVDPTVSDGITAYTNAFQSADINDANAAGGFSALGDMFGIGQVVVGVGVVPDPTDPPDGTMDGPGDITQNLPFGLIDDSVDGFEDAQGIVVDGTSGIADDSIFFGVIDTVNGDTSDPVTATWTIDISGLTDLAFEAGIAAMGDFESSDTFSLTAQIDGGTVQTLFDVVIDEDTSQDYTLADGDVFTLDDPALIGATVLTNVFADFAFDIVGTGSELTLSFTAEANGGTEAFAFNDAFITAVPEPASLALIGLGGLAMLGRRRA